MSTICRDNVHVRHLKHGDEFFSVTFREPDDFDRWNINVNCYCVPGRCDTYSFSWNTRQQTLTYFSEGNLPLVKAELFVTRDLNKDQVKELVVTMVRQANSRAYAKALLTLLQIISPASRTTKALTRLCA
jgi:hypothetical protein